MTAARQLPLNGLQDAVYRYLLTVPRATTEEVVAATAMAPPEVAECLAAMVDRGLVAPDRGPDDWPQPRPGAPERWRAVPPAAALGGSLAGLRAGLARAEQEMAELTALFQAAVPARGAELVEVVSGREAQGRRVAELEEHARNAIDVFQSGFNTVTSVEAAITEEDRTGGHRYRVVVDAAFLKESAAVRALDERVSAGHRVRVVDHPLLKLAIADGELAMVQVDPMVSLVLRGPLVRIATELFDSTWRRSRPYLREGDGLSRDDRQLLQLMMSGLTDAAMASQLGSSPRTVQRRLRALMDTAEVGTRMQLGWYALRNDWV
ncbi:LuxR family transcriptional regulator [Isoptericola hypogeus]|uniref:LuxR family transcriptional regulator n=1 Tax=Isoptericola hypogeus TaxID=300179 RepID=A0ABN2J740_9MICO